MASRSHELVGVSGRTVRMRFGVNAIVRIQETLREPFDTSLRRVLVQRGAVDIKTLRVMVQHAIEGRVSLSAAGDVLDDVGVQPVVAVLHEQFAKKGETTKWREDERRLRVQAAVAGVDTSRIGEMTLDDLAIEQEAAAERWTFWQRLAISTAWHVVAFTRSKQLPELGPLLEKVGAQKPAPALSEEADAKMRHYAMTLEKIASKKRAERSQQKQAQKKGQR